MYHIIVNPQAGKNKTLKALETVKEVFEKYGTQYVVHKGEHVGSARGIASAITKSPTVNVSVDDLLQEERKKERTKVIILGGDGTVHEVLNGIDVDNCEVGIIPSGTGNDFASAIGIPENVEEATKIILERPAKDTDYLEIDGVRCMNIAGVGIDVDVLNRYKNCKKHSKFTYLKSLIKSVFSYKGITITFERDGKEETHDAFIATACNGVQFGGGMRICPIAEADDGLLDVTVVDFVKGLPVVKALMKLLRGKILEYPKTHHFRCEEISFASSEPMIMQLDGEIYENLRFDVKVKRGLKIFR